MPAERRFVSLLTVALVFVVSSFALAGVAQAQTAPGDPTPNVPDPGGVPEQADPGPFDQLLDGLAPIHSDLPWLTDSIAASTFGSGGCTPGAATPTKDGGILIGTGSWTCGQAAPSLAIRVCVDRKVAGQWLEKRCHTKAELDASSVGTLTRATCDAGTWTYRTRVLAAAFDESGQPMDSGTTTSETTINCMTGPLNQQTLTEYLLLHNDTLYLAECDGSYLIVTGPTVDVLEASTGEEFDAYCELLLAGEDADEGFVPDPSPGDVLPSSLLPSMGMVVAGNAKCFLQDPDRLGTPGNDTLTGNFQGNVISALAGNDAVYGAGGDDYICGDDGDDDLYGEFDKDYMDGGGGDDDIYSGGGGSIIFGGEGNDYVDGGAGFDWIEGGGGSDTLLGEADGDLLYGDAGNDSIDGGSENDIADGGFGSDSIYGQTGEDRLYGGADSDSVDGGGGNDRINGHGGADTLRGGSEGDMLFGSSGGDEIWGESGNDCSVTALPEDPAPICRQPHGSDAGVYDGRGRDDLDGGTGYDELFVCADGVAEGSKTNFEVILAKAQEHCEGPSVASLADAPVSIAGIAILPKP